MKKLLVILLLFFPIHGAWGKEIKEMFGFRFGSNLTKENILKIYKDSGFWKYEVKPIIKNDDFTDYYIALTPISKKIKSIMANNNGKKEYTDKDKIYNLSACKIKMKNIKTSLAKKYDLKVKKKEDLRIVLENKFNYVAIECLDRLEDEFSPLMMISSSIRYQDLSIREEEEKIKAFRSNDVDPSGF